MQRLTALLCRSSLMVAVGGFVLHLVALASLNPTLAALFLATLVWRRLQRFRAYAWSHGSACWASWRDVIAANLLASKGLIFGTTGYLARPGRGLGFSLLFRPSFPSALAVRIYLASVFGRWLGDGPLIRLNTFTHIATFAPTGMGKGVSCITPNLLAYPDSCVAVDVDGEAFARTAEHRRKKFGHQIVVLDPYGLKSNASDTFNPFDGVSVDTMNFIDDLRDIAGALVVRSGMETDSHWNDAAEISITCFAALVCALETDSDKRNLSGVKESIASLPGYLESVETMQLMAGFNRLLSRLGHQQTWFAERELNSVMTTTLRHLAFLDSPLIAKNTATSSFDPRRLRSGKMTVYLVIPSTRLIAAAGLVRLWLSSFLRMLAQDAPGESNKILFFIDEAAHLGRIKALEQAVTLLRKSGIRLWFFFQSMGQLRDCFGENAAVALDNFGTQQFFAINAYETAEMLSKRIGDETITLRSHNRSTSHSRPTGGPGRGSHGGSVSTSYGVNYSPHGKPLLRPDELIRKAADFSILLHRNLPPIPIKLIRFYDSPYFRNGGCGQARGVGLASMLCSLLLLVASFGFRHAVTHLPTVLPPVASVNRRRVGGYLPLPYRNAPSQSRTDSGWQGPPWLAPALPRNSGQRRQGFY